MTASKKRTGDARVCAVPELHRVEILGTPVSVGSLQDIVIQVEALLDQRAGGYVCFANVHLIETARENDAVCAALHDAELVLADGAPIAWLARAVSTGAAARVAGSDLFHELCSRSRDGRYSHFFLGGRPDTAARLRIQVEEQYPGIRIAGVFSPPFESSLDQYVEEIAERVRASAADIVWVGLGAPKQELLMQQLRAQLPHSLALGVGAVFDFVSGDKERAPRWMQRWGLEWAHRLMTEPRRLWRRYLVTNSRFVWHALAVIVSQHSPFRKGDRIGDRP